jgi:hypothetical protein
MGTSRRSAGIDVQAKALERVRAKQHGAVGLAEQDERDLGAVGDLDEGVADLDLDHASVCQPEWLTDVRDHAERLEERSRDAGVESSRVDPRVERFEAIALKVADLDTYGKHAHASIRAWASARRQV